MALYHFILSPLWECTYHITLFRAVRSRTVTFPIYIDPAGYIYDISSGERIPGAMVWLQSPDESGTWMNVSTGLNPPVMQPDVNPQITNSDGQYQWDTLSGSYRIYVEANGYTPATSTMVNIPPPVFDLNVGLIPVSVPLGVSNLRNTTYETNAITWVWTDPASENFDHVQIYLDGVFRTNVTKGNQTFTATGLIPSTTHIIGTRTVDTTGLIVSTWVNQHCDDCT